MGKQCNVIVAPGEVINGRVSAANYVANGIENAINQNQ